MKLFLLFSMVISFSCRCFSSYVPAALPVLRSSISFSFPLPANRHHRQSLCLSMTSSEGKAAPKTNSSPSGSSPQFFLLKSEPSDFSIDDLKACGQEEWDGVRNYGARNTMREMRVGDEAFVYHSSCKVPGIVGTCTIVREAQPDATAWEDRTSPYYDPKCTSAEDCPWDSVLVQFKEKYDSGLTLKEIKAKAKTNQDIAEMSLVKISRLSVSRVTPEQWKILHDMIREKEEKNVGANTR